MPTKVTNILKELASKPEATFIDLHRFNDDAFSAVAIEGTAPRALFIARRILVNNQMPMTPDEKV